MFQAFPLAANRNPVTVGATAPPKWPSMFMKPETVPTRSPPMSIAVVQEIGPVEYRVIGQGDDVPRLRALAAGLGVARYVNFMGGISDAELRSQYGRCSLFVMPSKKEGFGIVFLEAMAYGKPVIGGAHGGTPSVVKDGETGLLIDNADIVGIANSISQLLSNEGMREQFGNAGHQRLLDEFTFEKFEHNLQEVFRLLS